MKYENIVPGIFLNRPNRFIAEVIIGDKIEKAHIKNTGRCKELFLEGARVIMQRASNPKRTTKYDLIAVWKGKRLINVDSQAPNKVFLEYLQSGKYIENITLLKPEAKFGTSRFDFYIEAGRRKIFLEIKGVTLEENGVVLFPDAPTERGVKHLQELIGSLKQGYEAQVIFVAQMEEARYFAPNNKTHPEFGTTLVAAEKAGVKVVAFDCLVTAESIIIDKKIPCRL
jgi:sugar fermentation stimulation protein